MIIDSKVQINVIVSCCLFSIKAHGLDIGFSVKQLVRWWAFSLPIKLAESMKIIGFIILYHLN
jgi:hypothetical protein